MERADLARLARRLEAGAADLGAVLPPGTVSKLLALGAEIVRWSPRVDLVGPTDLETLVSRHLLDAMPLVPLLRDLQIRRLVDLGSGAGLPGLVLALADPGLDLVSIEPRGRRAAFQRHAIRLLGLPRVQVVQARAEAGAPAPVALADAVVARAVAPLAELLPIASPLVRPGGVVIAMLGPGEPAAEGRAPVRTVRYELPAEGREQARSRRLEVFPVG